MQKIQAVLFDMGGTLINYPSPNNLRELCYERADEIGVDGSVLKEIIRLFSEERRLGKKSKTEALISEAIRRAFFKEGTVGGADKAEEVLWKIFLVGFSRRASVVDGADEVLGILRSSGCALGIVSNTPFPGAFHLHDFRRLNLPTGAFRSFVWSSEFGKRKPDAEIFKKALADIRVQPEGAVHVGDKISRDVKGALAAGITPIWLDRGTNGQDYKGYRITSLRELPRLIGEINSRR